MTITILPISPNLLIVKLILLQIYSLSKELINALNHKAKKRNLI